MNDRKTQSWVEFLKFNLQNSFFILKNKFKFKELIIVMVFPFIPLLSRSFIAHNNIYRLITSLIKVISYITLKYPVVKTMKQNFQNYNHVHNTLRFFDVWANFRELIWKLEVCRKYFVNGRFMPLFVWPLLVYWYSTWGFKQLKLWVYRLFNVLWVNTIS